MGNWSNIQNALASVQPASSRVSGLASVISKVAERLKKDRESGQELEEKKNLLGYAGLMEGKIEKAQEGEQGAMNVPGVGWVKKTADVKESAMANYYNAIANQLKSGGGIGSDDGTLGNAPEADVMTKFGIPEEESEDYYLKPRMVRNRGITSSTPFPERKRDLSQKTVEQISGISSTVSDLMKNLQTQEKEQFKSGPGITTRGGAAGDIAAQFFRGPEFVSWKSDVGRAFQKYRKWATGVAAGYPELNLLAPNFPKTTDMPEVFKQKTQSAIDDMERNRDTFLDYLSKSNYVTSQYKSIKKQPSINDEDDNGEITPEQARQMLKQRGIKGY